MEIDKLTFDQFKTQDITKSFEDLDVNSDGKITEADKTSSTDAEITAQITKLLASVDDEPELTDDASDKKAGETSGDTGEYSKLKAKLDTINKKLDGINPQITALSEANKVLANQQKNLEADKSNKEKTLQDANDKLAKEQETLKNYIEKYEEIQEEVKRINDEILSEQQREATNYEQSVSSITNKAIEEYNPETDGDNFDAYLAKKLDEGGYAVFSNLDSLNTKASNLEYDMASILKNVTSQTSVVQRAKSAVKSANNAVTDATNRLNSVNGKIQTNNVQIQGLEATKAAKEAE